MQASLPTVQQALDAAQLGGHGSGTVSGLGYGLVDVPAARQELPDPDAEARDEDSGAGD